MQVRARVDLAAAPHICLGPPLQGSGLAPRVGLDPAAERHKLLVLHPGPLGQWGSLGRRRQLGSLIWGPGPLEGLQPLCDPLLCCTGHAPVPRGWAPDPDGLKRGKPAICHAR